LKPLQKSDIERQLQSNVEKHGLELAMNRLRKAPVDPTAEPKSASRLSRLLRPLPQPQDAA
jgi:hypothetical protein